MQSLTLLLALAATAQAHFRFPKIMVNGVADTKEWANVRQTKNYQDNHGVTTASSPDLRCFQAGKAGGTATIEAGGKLGFVAAASINHFGPVQVYMAKAPAGADISSWDAAGNVWFKVASFGANPAGAGGHLTSDKATWPLYGQSTVEFTIPKSTPSGDYLVRVEAIALHQATSVGGAQFYLSCAQVKITDGGSGTPGPLVAIPGMYKDGEPGLMWNYSPVPSSYTPPGPKVWEG